MKSLIASVSALLIVSCNSSKAPDSPPPASAIAAPKPAEATAAPAAPAAPAPSFLVGRTDGIVEVDLDGKPVHQISHSPAKAVRQLADGRYTTFDHGVLRLIDPAHQAETIVATLPTDIACRPGWGGERNHTRIDYLDGRSFIATADAIEITLADLEWDPMVELIFTICLHDGQPTVFVDNLARDCKFVGAAARGVRRAKHTCHVPGGAGEPDQPGPHDEPAITATATPQLPFVVKDDRVIRAPGDPIFARSPSASDASDASVLNAVSLSPSGHWLLLSGQDYAGDINWRRYLLLDRATGAIFPVPQKPAWPAPVELARLGKTPADEKDGVPTSGGGWVSSVRPVEWVTGAPHDVLLAGSFLVHAGSHVVDLQGMATRTLERHAN